jgi:stage III sporulation protein AD
MTLFIQAAAAVLTAAVLGLCLEKQGKDMALVLTLCVCTMVITAAFVYLKPLVDFLGNLREWIKVDAGILSLLVKVVGIGLVSEVAVLICADAGRASLGKALQILSSGVILTMSIPIFTMLMDLIGSVLGGF